MVISMPSTFCDAKQLLEDNLNTYRRVVVKRFNEICENSCDLIHFHITEVEDEEQYASLDISLNYKERIIIGSVDRFDTVERFRQLRILCNLGDNHWTARTKHKIWNDDYPSTVAVDMETKQVFLVYIRPKALELVEFGIFSASEFEAFLTDANDREPFAIKLDPEAMFRYIDGATGIDDLYKNVYIEFNCTAPINIYCRRDD